LVRWVCFGTLASADGPASRFERLSGEISDVLAESVQSDVIALILLKTICSELERRSACKRRFVEIWRLLNPPCGQRCFPRSNSASVFANQADYLAERSISWKAFPAKSLSPLRRRDKLESLYGWKPRQMENGDQR